MEADKHQSQTEPEFLHGLPDYEEHTVQAEVSNSYHFKAHKPGSLLTWYDPSHATPIDGKHHRLS